MLCPVSLLKRVLHKLNQVEQNNKADVNIIISSTNALSCDALYHTRYEFPMFCITLVKRVLHKLNQVEQNNKADVNIIKCSTKW